MSDDESLTLRTTVIAGIRYADDYQVVWRDMPIGRIMRASGTSSDKPQWCGMFISTAGRRRQRRRPRS
jgi:hypothetical protein